MPTKRKHVWVIVALIILAGIFYAYKEYFRKPADLLSVNSQASIDANTLITLYEKDEQKANNLFLGKPIDVKGIISEIHNQQDTIMNVMLGKIDEMHRVSCLVNINYVKEMKRYKPGDSITLRGICTGYLIDVELNRCVVVR